MTISLSRWFWGNVMIMAYEEQTETVSTHGERKLARKGFEPASWHFAEGWDR